MENFDNLLFNDKTEQFIELLKKVKDEVLATKCYMSEDFDGKTKY